MTESGSKNLSESPQQAAASFAERLSKLSIKVDDLRHDGKSTLPSQRVVALIEDSISLCNGISKGAISIGQPRIATNLIEVADSLGKIDQYELAESFTYLLRSLSDDGLAAESCPIRGGRGLPSRDRS